MSQSEKKIVQHLNEAHATEVGLVRVLQSQIAMTPRGSYRTGLEKHLRETEAHAERVQARLGEVAPTSGHPLLAGIGFMEAALSQTLAFWKTPLDLLRGASGEEKVLKNAKDACAAEALEIATYTALEHLARAVGDDTTAELAASIRGDEERMLEFVVAELPKLARAVVRSEVDGRPSYDVAKTAAADAVREAASETRVARSATAAAVRPARQARKAPAAAQALTTREGATAGPKRSTQSARRARPAARAAAARGGAAPPGADELPISGYDERTAEEIGAKLADLSQTELARVGAYERAHDNRSTVLTRIEALQGDEPWSGYDRLTVEEIGAKLTELSQTELAKVDAYERKHNNRSTVLTRISALQGDEPWPGYDDLTVDEIRAGVGDDDERASAVRSYERAHKNRAGVLTAVEREHANA
jgi:ferritin-like metal-binding protein YciE